MYVQGFLLAVPGDKRDEYTAMAEAMWATFEGYGCLELVETWEDNVPDGKVTDFRMATKAEEGEKIVFSWLIWPDRATCDAAAEKMSSDPAFAEGMPEMPFDGKRMMWGGFEPIVCKGRADGM